MIQPTNTFPRTIGMDLGSRKCNFCFLDAAGKRVEEGVLPTKRPVLEEFFRSQPASRIVIEASGPSRWIAELAQSLSHEVVVANPREFHLICKSHRKNDRNDARILADIGQIRPHLLRPVRLRGLTCQLTRATIAARSLLVRERTQMINFIRAQMRNIGETLPPNGSASTFHKKADQLIPEALRAVVTPLLTAMARLADSIAEYDQELKRLAKEEYPETALLLQVHGVGPITAVSFVATIEDPARFPSSRDVGAYLGLVPRSHESSESAPQLPISKQGDQTLRGLLVSAATYMLGPRAKDSDLRRFGLRLQERGSQAAKAKARIAVARKLAVLLHRLLVTSEVYEPLRLGEPVAA